MKEVYTAVSTKETEKYAIHEAEAVPVTKMEERGAWRMCFLLVRVASAAIAIFLVVALVDWAPNNSGDEKTVSFSFLRAGNGEPKKPCNHHHAKNGDMRPDAMGYGDFPGPPPPPFYPRGPPPPPRGMMPPPPPPNGIMPPPPPPPGMMPPPPPPHGMMKPPPHGHGMMVPHPPHHGMMVPPPPPHGMMPPPPPRGMMPPPPPPPPPHGMVEPGMMEPGMTEPGMHHGMMGSGMHPDTMGPGMHHGMMGGPPPPPPMEGSPDWHEQEFGKSQPGFWGWFGFGSGSSRSSSSSSSVDSSDSSDEGEMEGPEHGAPETATAAYGVAGLEGSWDLEIFDPSVDESLPSGAALGEVVSMLVDETEEGVLSEATSEMEEEVPEEDGHHVFSESEEDEVNFLKENGDIETAERVELP